MREACGRRAGGVREPCGSRAGAVREPCRTQVGSKWERTEAPQLSISRNTEYLDGKYNGQVATPATLAAPRTRSRAPPRAPNGLVGRYTRAEGRHESGEPLQDAEFDHMRPHHLRC